LKNVQQELSHTIYQKLQRLVKEHEQLKKENVRLQQQLEEHQSTGNHHSQRVEELEAQLTLLKSNLGQTDAAAKKEMERRINQYIKDIDNAIMLLNE
jgi:predicted nuclease with TOPRIM domain